MNTFDFLLRNRIYRRIGLTGIFIFLISLDAVVDIFLHPSVPFINDDHIVVGCISGLIGFFFLGLTASLVRRLAKSEFEKQAIVHQFDYQSKYANECVLLTDEKRRVIIEANDRASGIYGYTHDELIGMDIIHLLAHHERPGIESIPSMLNLEEGVVFEARHQRKDGSTFFVEASVRRFMQDGKPYLHGIVRDISERKQAQELIQHQHNRLRRLAARLDRIREEERKILSREIHDRLGQELAAIKMNIAVLASHSKHDEKLSASIQYIRNLVDTSIHSARKLSMELRPSILDELGLGAAIEWHAREFEKKHGISCTHKIDRTPVKVNDGISIALILILQELLANVVQHAEASQVVVKFDVEGKNLQLVVYDNGNGIPKNWEDQLDSFGIFSIRERAFHYGGTVTIDSLTVHGTRVTVLLPEAVQ